MPVTVLELYAAEGAPEDMWSLASYLIEVPEGYDVEALVDHINRRLHKYSGGGYEVWVTENNVENLTSHTFDGDIPEPDKEAFADRFEKAYLESEDEEHDDEDDGYQD